MGLTVYHAPLPDGIFGRTYFNDANVEVFTNKTCSETEDRTICPEPYLLTRCRFYAKYRFDKYRNPRV